ncbi:MAG TPA: DCC1-like thiol-disulfide oxidoreductase family protein [Acidimicrobiales bacterium]|nr:DCC1-like thiol-disulfide oxidoreductase family protein [Acidimicrobiales bacterium]
MADDLPLLVYDGDCAFCTRMVDIALSRMKVACRAVPWQQADLAVLGLTEAEVTEKVWWVEPGVSKVSGHRAVAAALRHGSPGLRPFGHLLDAAPVAPVASAGYDLVARNRHRLPGGTSACRIDPDAGGSADSDDAPAAES